MVKRIAFAIILLLPALAQDNEQTSDLSTEQAYAVQWMVDHGAPASYRAVEIRVNNFVQYTYLALDFDCAPRRARLSLKLATTGYGPYYALHDIARECDIPVKIEPYQPLTLTVTVPVAVNPIGQPREGHPGQFTSARGDNAPIGAVWADATGRYVKKRGWQFFVPISYWETIRGGVK